MAVASLPRLQCPRGEVVRSPQAEPASSTWRDVPPVVFRENVSGGEPDQGTRVRACWDDQHWRILFESDDLRPWATLTERDAPLWTEEVVEVFFDPVGDLESYFEVEINPLGAVVDLVLRRTLSGWRKSFAWKVEGLQSHARLTPSGWAAELWIPFAAVCDVSPKPGTSWKANFLRIDRPRGSGTEAELSAWSPTGVRNFHRAECFGTMEFVG